MIDDFGHAMVCDFGVDVTMRSIHEYCVVHPRYRYKAPELLYPETNAIPCPTYPADVYSLGRVIQEVYQQALFHDMGAD